MPLTTAKGVSQVNAEIQHLLNHSSMLKARGIEITDAQRYSLLRAIAADLAFLHDHAICVGDISPKNLLFALSPREGAYFIDCDTMNVNGISALPQTGAEHIDAYEAGYKHTIGKRLRVNLAGFYYDYQGLQVPLTVSQPGGAQLTQFFNLASSKSYGAEVELAWQPVNPLQLSFNYG